MAAIEPVFGFGERERSLTGALGAQCQVVAWSLEQSPGALLTYVAVSAELVEEDTVLDVGESGALVDWVELQRRQRRRRVDSTEPHVVRRGDAVVLHDVGVCILVPRDWTFVEFALSHVPSADAEVEGPVAGLHAVAAAPPAQICFSSANASQTRCTDAG
ncbi:hypothetical protein IV498_09575 [Paenarthrobacter sp. Z7-10]|nr:hypothetical protein [Paenarthrobacter sp. Z7-10]